MWGLGVYMDCRDWFGLVQDLMGQKLERYCHILIRIEWDVVMVAKFEVS